MSAKRGGHASTSPSPASRRAAEADPPVTGPGSGPRRPQQERGQRRVDAILDATAAIIAEEGLAGVTMHGVARRSGTTTGSMYHFFPDREALIEALAERHARAIRERLSEVERATAERWSSLTTEQAVGRFLDPFLAYAEEHPDLSHLMRRPRATGMISSSAAELYRLVLRVAEAVVASRAPGASPTEVRNRAFTFVAMASGVESVLNSGIQGRPDLPSATAMRRELRRALVAYLDSYADDGAGARPTSGRVPSRSRTPA